MDFESLKRVRIVKAVEVIIVLAFFAFTAFQIYKYILIRDAETRAEREAVEKQLEKAKELENSSLAENVEPQEILYEGLHPYASVDLPYDLVSLTIQNEDGTAVYTNGKEAGVNLPLKSIKDEATGALTAVDLSLLENAPLSLSGTGANPTLNVRYKEGYSIKAVLGHAFQASVNKDGDLSLFNIQEGDTFDISYTFNLDSYKYPGTPKFTLGGTATGNGAIKMQVRGDILTVTGLPFEKAMLSVGQEVTEGGYGVSAESDTGFYTYNFKTKEGSNKGVKKGD